MKAIIDAHFLPERHCDSLVKELKRAGCELHRDRWLKVIFVERGEEKTILKIARKYDQKVNFYRV